MSTQAGDSQKSLIRSEIWCSDALLDSASDFLHATGAAEIFFDGKRRGSYCTGDTFAIGIEEGCAMVSSPSIDSDGVLCSFPENQTIRQIGSQEGMGGLESPTSWGPSRKLWEAAVFLFDFSPGELIHVSGSSSSGTTSRSPEQPLTVGTGRRAATDAHVPEISPASDIQHTSPSQRTTAAGSSIQTSALSEVDADGFIITEGTYERLPPFVHYEPPSDSRTSRQDVRWRTMLENAEEHWADICQFHSKLLKKRVRKGIPKDWRYRAWPLLSGGRMLQQNNPNAYARLSRSMCDVRDDDRIRNDLHRTLPRHIFFTDFDGAGQRSLYNCLKAYAVYDPEVGYVQGMASILAPLLLVMSEEDAFWTFTALMREEAPYPRPTTAGPHVGCRRLYLDGLPMTQELTSKLEHLMIDKFPRLHQWLDSQELSCSAFTSRWWMTLFCFVLPFQHVLRVWDIFFLEGWKMALRTGLAILKYMEPKLINPESQEPGLSLLDASDIARSLPPPGEFIRMALSMRISKSLDSWHASVTEA